MRAAVSEPERAALARRCSGKGTPACEVPPPGLGDKSRAIETEERRGVETYVLLAGTWYIQKM